MPMSIPVLDFAATAKKARKMSIESLIYSINDCREAIQANPQAEKSQGYYQDEMSVYSAELKIKQSKLKAKR